MPTPPEICTRLPICAQLPTVDQGVDHGRLIDIGAEIDEGRHQHDVAGDERRTAHDRAGDGAEACIAKTVLAPALELRGHLVPPRGLARAAGYSAHVVEAERQQHRLLQPLIDLPLAASFALGDARLALVEQFERVIYSLANFALGRRRNAVAGIEGGVDGGFERGQGHRDFLRLSGEVDGLFRDLGGESQGGKSVVARMERSAIRDCSPFARPSPDFAALHPGYAALNVSKNPVRSSVT
ncbi:hypothetical protein V1294_000074 [Bradyrhizobium sp. AZCC 1678]